MKPIINSKPFAFIIPIIFFFSFAHAQIVYSDVEPDSTVRCGSAFCYKTFNLDLNNDSINDFVFQTETGSGTLLCGDCGRGNTHSVIVSPTNGSQILVSPTNGGEILKGTYPIALDSL